MTEYAVYRTDIYPMEVIGMVNTRTSARYLIEQLKREDPTGSYGFSVVTDYEEDED